MVTRPSRRTSFSRRTDGLKTYSFVWPSSRRSHSNPLSTLPVFSIERSRIAPQTARIVPEASGSRIRIFFFQRGSRRLSQSWGASAAVTAALL